MASNRPTMNDIASAAGVGLTTVSRVVNDRPGVREDKTRRVREAIDRLGYRRNDLASSLRSRRTSESVGLVIEDVANPFYGVMTRAIEEVARGHGRILITSSSDERPDRERELVNALFRRRVDGMIVVPASTDHRYMLREIEAGTPVVFVDRPPIGIQADAVLSDNRGGAREAIRYLIGRGHQAIGILAHGPAVYTADERLAGCRDAFADAGIEIPAELVSIGAYSEADAERDAERLLNVRPRPSALFTTNNRMTVGALRAARRQGIELDLVAFDDFELADFLRFPIAVVRHDPAELGRWAADLLFDRIGGANRRPVRIVVPTTLIPAEAETGGGLIGSL